MADLPVRQSAVALTAAAVLFGALGVVGRQALPLAAWAGAARLTAISMRGPGEGVVLQSDGRVLSFNEKGPSQSQQIYQVPSRYSAIDLAAGIWNQRSVLCLSLNGRKTSGLTGHLLQVFQGGQQVWVELPSSGVYVGVALDARAGVTYVGNSSNNIVYRVKLGQEKGAVTELTTLGKAQRIGAMALDSAGQRLFVSEMSSGELHVISLTNPRSAVRLDLPGIEEIRAIAWNPTSQRLYVADSGKEALWIVTPSQASATVQRFGSVSFNEPSGLTVGSDGTVWAVDARSPSAVQLAPDTGGLMRRLHVAR
jgi:DNA-binding beta-propeller fold protein YncE